MGVSGFIGTTEQPLLYEKYKNKREGERRWKKNVVIVKEIYMERKRGKVMDYIVKHVGSGFIKVKNY